MSETTIGVIVAVVIILLRVLEKMPMGGTNGKAKMNTPCFMCDERHRLIVDALERIERKIGRQ